MSVTIPTAHAMEAVGFAMGAVARAGDVVILSGPLGAGKTTFARGFGEGLTVETPVSSPTFVVAREHPSTDATRPPLVHIDAYRLGSAGELDELDIDVEHCVVVAEWAAPYASVLSDRWIEISFDRPVGGGGDLDSDQPRQLTLVAHGESGNTLARFGQVLGGLDVSRR
jgi:tRNA threonylcarbamoyladenosine biosynthesis protein TsaE